MLNVIMNKYVLLFTKQAMFEFDYNDINGFLTFESDKTKEQLIEEIEIVKNLNQSRKLCKLRYRKQVEV